MHIYSIRLATDDKELLLRQYIQADSPLQAIAHLLLQVEHSGESPTNIHYERLQVEVAGGKQQARTRTPTPAPADPVPVTAKASAPAAPKAPPPGATRTAALRTRPCGPTPPAK